MRSCITCIQIWSGPRQHHSVEQVPGPSRLPSDHGCCIRRKRPALEADGLDDVARFENVQVQPAGTCLLLIAITLLSSKQPSELGLHSDLE